MNGEYIQIICTNMLATKTSFGVRTDDGSQVFIPASISAAIDLRVGNIVMALLVPNHLAPEKTPWVAINIRPKEPAPATPEPEIEIVTPDARAYAFVEESGYATTAEVSIGIGVAIGDTRTILNRLFRRGAVARADVHANSTQTRPSFCLWAINTAQFVSDGAGHDE
tara:strand:- start:950 stop:1450 length:501 start_codon:yes stop_codon:yes gene_type:complete